MQWISEYPTWLALFLLPIIYAVVCWWLSQKKRADQDILRLQYQIQNQKSIYEQKVHHLEVSLEKANQKIEEISSRKDQAHNELKLAHGKFMAMTEKVCHLETMEKERNHFMQQMNEAREEKSDLGTRLRELQASHREQHEQNKERIQFLKDSEIRLKQQFESLAGRIFDLKSSEVDQRNRRTLEGLLNPLKDQIDAFRRLVNDGFSQESKERHVLAHELKSLQRLNEKMAEEAINLTQALKGDNKQQGNWGEVILARALEQSGLREGHEYQTQVSLRNEEGKRYQPDVIVFLPNNKQVVIDSKMALIGYERYFHAEDISQKNAALNDHLVAIRNHIKSLGKKDYHHLSGLNSLDYVLMFIPIEPAFQVAIQSDPSLVKEAMSKNVILVSPSTLIVVLRTIDSLWKNERQNQNTQVIASKASKMYEKLRLFVEDMDTLGKALDRASGSYQGAMNKLVSGRGNIIRQAESFRELGVECKQPIPRSTTEKAQSD